MTLLPAWLRKKLPRRYAQEHAPDPVVHIKYFTPDSSWTWFVTEGEEDEGGMRFFGLVVGHETEWGYFLLSDLERLRGPLGLRIERDHSFRPRPLSEVTREDQF